MEDYKQDFASYVEFQGTHPWDRVNAAIAQIRSTMPRTMYPWFIATLLYPFVFRSRSRVAIMAFFWWPLIFLTVGTTSLTEYQPPMIMQRYYALIVLPGSLMIAAVVVATVQRWDKWSRRPSVIDGRKFAAILDSLSA